MRKLLFFFVVIGILSSCKNTGKQQSANDTLNPKLAEYYERTKEVFEKPSKPSQISALLELSGAPLMPEFMNDPSNWEKYTNDDVSAAANMGIYLADAIVQYAYDSIKQAYKSAIAGKALAEQIGIGEDIFMNYLIRDRYAEEGGQSDSLFFVLDSALIRADSSLNTDERFKLLAAMYVGNYIEKQYIVSNIIFNYPVELPEESKTLILRELMLVLAGSLDRLDYIIELVEKATTKKDGGYLLKELKELKRIHVENKFSDEEILTLQASDIFENEGMLNMHKEIVKMRQYIVAADN